MVADIVVSVILVGIVAAIVYVKAKARKADRKSCGCHCSGCPSSDSCHTK